MKNLSTKTCPVCNRPFEWRKKWKNVGMMLSTVQKDAVTENHKDETSINYLPESTF